MPIRSGRPAMWALAAAIWIGVAVVWVSGHDAPADGDAAALASDVTASGGVHGEDAPRDAATQQNAAPHVPGATLPVVRATLNGIPVTLEIAETPAAMQRGLMYRETMPDDHGMLFAWPDERPRAMWMHNTPLPLSVAFLAADGRVLNIADMQPMTQTVHESAGPARFAIEMHQGWFARHGIAAGQTLRVEIVSDRTAPSP